MGCFSSFIEVFSSGLFDPSEIQRRHPITKRALCGKVFVTKLWPCIPLLSLPIGIQRIRLALNNLNRSTTRRPGSESLNIPSKYINRVNYPAKGKLESVFMLMRGVLEAIGVGIICLLLEILLSLSFLISNFVFNKS